MTIKKTENIPDTDSKSFTSHLDDLRKHLIRIILVVLLLSIVAFIFKNLIFDKILFAPKEANFITYKALCYLGSHLKISSMCINVENFPLINLELAGQFRAHIVVSIISGIILSFPYLIWELWRFVKPALKVNERKYSRSLILSTSILFFAGVLFGYFIITPLTINFLSTYEVSHQLQDMFNFRNYISIITTLTLAIGIVFELPVLVYFLSKMDIISPLFLKKYRKHAIVLLFIISAIITPPDVFSQILVAIPLYLLFELSIIISKRVYKKKEKEIFG
ncbi:MAG: twin-arginine translocase subunit TatC [Bacteroidota bacterium]